MFKKILLIFSFIVSLSAEQIVLEQITIEQIHLSLPTQTAQNPLDIKNIINKEAIELFANSAQTSTYETLDTMAGFISEAKDPYGLSGVSARSRGIDSNFMNTLFNGVSTYSIRPIGPRDGIYDLENIETIEHYQGAITPSSGHGVGSKAGLINIQTIKPKKGLHSKVALSGGGDEFYKIFARVDGGDDDLAGFISLSQTDAKKYKGYGDLGPRRNLALGVSYEPLSLLVLYSHNEQKQHEFKPLTFSQTQNLKQNYKLDYSNNAGSNDYYDFYKKETRYDDVQLTHTNSFKDINMEIKLYASSYDEKSDEGITGSGAGRGLQKGRVDAKRVGTNLKLNTTYENTFAEIGLWHEQSWLDKHVRRADKNNEALTKSWAWLNKSHGPTKLLSPYILLQQKFEYFTLEAGGRYLYYKEAPNDTYMPNNSYTDYDDAIRNGTIAQGGSVDAMHYKEFLPTLGISAMVLDDYELYAKYGKGYQRPYRYSFAAQYAANKDNIRTKVLAQGKTLQDIVNAWGMETSDLFDLGVRSYFDNAEITLNGFYNIHHNILHSAYDATLDANYLQNVGEAKVYGVELQTTLMPTEKIWLFCNPALTYSKLTRDINYGNTNYSLKN
ncbi:MAG: TonB-dependent receptor, partial [Sulfurimonadaceae bacterium]|nr:TonB-dependent receptor [Sulfurimonadaceae bacterium]